MSVLDRFRGHVELRPGFVPVSGIRQVVFDWDGTLSFVRAGWAEVMREQWIEALPALAGESESELRQLVHGEIWRLNGRPSIHQAARLSEWVAERGGSPLSALDYENEYQRRLVRSLPAVALQPGMACRRWMPGLCREPAVCWNSSRLVE